MYPAIDLSSAFYWIFHRLHFLSTTDLIQCVLFWRPIRLTILFDCHYTCTSPENFTSTHTPRLSSNFFFQYTAFPAGGSKSRNNDDQLQQSRFPGSLPIAIRKPEDCSGFHLMMNSLKQKSLPFDTSWRFRFNLFFQNKKTKPSLLRVCYHSGW